MKASAQTFFFIRIQPAHTLTLKHKIKESTGTARVLGGSFNKNFQDLPARRTGN